MPKALAGMLCATWLLAACSSPAGPASGDPPEHAPLPASPPAVVEESPVIEQPVPRSEYSRIQPGQCTLESRDAESGATRHLCEGVAGYDLRVRDDDARMSLDVIEPGGDVRPLSFHQATAGGFSELGEQVEWRFAPGSAHPGALIVRFGEYVEPDRPTSWLLVARIAGVRSCVISKIPPGPAQNDQARAMADVAAERPCLVPAAESGDPDR